MTMVHCWFALGPHSRNGTLKVVYFTVAMVKHWPAQVGLIASGKILVCSRSMPYSDNGTLLVGSRAS